MNFLAQQGHARRQTRKLVFLFALAVLAIVAAVNGALALAWSWTRTGMVFGLRDWPRGFFATDTGVTLALIGGGTLIQMVKLRDGGDAVGAMAGGRLVPSSSTDLLERRLLNVVEEMAIAAGIGDPHGARALAHALLLARGPGRDAQLALLPPAEAKMSAFLAEKIAPLPKSARLPLLDLAAPALKRLDAAQRGALLQAAERLIAADHAARAVPVRYSGLAALGQDCAVLLSMAAHVGAAGGRGEASALFAAGAARLREHGLSSSGLMPVAALGLARVSRALEHAHRLAPLAKPLLIKAMLAAAGQPLSADGADLLRATCAALEAPVPDAVAASYPHFHW